MKPTRMLLLLALAAATLPAATPPAAADHVCDPLEPPWACNHTKPSAWDLLTIHCRLDLPPALKHACRILPPDPDDLLP